MRSQSCKAYAKINLTLDITGRRPDGYHFHHRLPALAHQ